METLASKAGVSYPTINRVESGGQSYDSTRQKLVDTFAAHGVEVFPAPRDGARRL